MDLLAAIAADPTLLPLWAVMLFAAGMYPIGMIFGCSPCCNPDPCVCASGATLPETITVTLGGFEDYAERSYLTSLSFSSCYGTGAAGRVESPGQSAPGSDIENDRGPVASVSLSSGGSGYAKLGRAAPAVTVSGTSGAGSGATFDVTLAQTKDSCGLDRWAVSKITTLGGDGYLAGDWLTFAVANGDTQQSAAWATISGPPGVASSNGYFRRQISSLSFSACYGSGGSGVVEEPANEPGPITAVSLTDGGSGYAKLGRTAPALSASVSTATGSGASLDVTVTKAAEPDECGLHYWEVSKVTLVDGGTGYEPSDFVDTSLSEGDTAEVWAVISITLAQLPPEITLGVTSQTGTGAALTPHTKENPWSTPESRSWEISSVTVDDGGDGYTHLDAVHVTRGPGTVFADGAFADGNNEVLLTITANTEPTVSASVQSAGGTGAALTVTLTETEIYPPPSYGAVTVWAVQSIAVDSPGTGYAVLDQVTVSVVDGDSRSDPASSLVWAVDGNGGIVEVLVFSGGRYFKGGPITAVSVVAGGGYVKRNGQIESASVLNGGKYYREDASLPPYVANVTATVNQTAPSAGAGAVITATVEDDPQSPDFGKVTGLSVTNGGSGYVGRQLDAMKVSVASGGVYYREDASLPPYIANVSIGISQTQPSNGSGAIISATIDSDTSSSSFGKVTGLTVANGGGGYLAYHWTGQHCVGHYLNGEEIVLNRVVDANADYCFQLTNAGNPNWPFDPLEPNNKNLRKITFPLLDTSPPVFGIPRNDKIVASCVYAHRFCGGWTDPFLTPVFASGVLVGRYPQQNREKILLVGFNGEGKPAVARLADDCGASLSAAGASAGSINQEWIADAPIETCSQFEWSKTNANGVSISVAPGGEYDPEWRFSECSPAAGNCRSCNVCCQGDGEPPVEVEVQIADEWTTNRPSGLPDFSGTYVAPLWWPNYWVFNGNAPPGFSGLAFQASLYPCHQQSPFASIAPGATCETCIKKCLTMFHSLSLTWGANSRTITPEASSNECAECEDTPICKPSQKTFSLLWDGAHVATATIQ